MKKTDEAKLKQELNQGMDKNVKKKERPKIYMEENLPPGVENEHTRMIKRGQIKKEHIEF